MPGKCRQLAAQAKALLNEIVGNKQLALSDQGMIDLDHRADHRRTARSAAAHDQYAALFANLLAHKIGILQGRKISLVALDVIGQAEDIALRDAGVFRRLRGKFLMSSQPALVILQQKRDLHIFEESQLIHGVEARSRARIAGGKNQIAFFGALF